jgi:hypothetical protein
MKVSEFRSIADALSRHATTREKNSGPTSRIGVQVSGGVLKLISGSSTAGMVVDVQPADGRFNYTVDARPLLQAAKILPAKDTMEITASPDELGFITSAGGGLKLKPNGQLQDAGFAKKPKEFRARASVPGDEWVRLAKTIKEVAGDIVAPSMHVVGDAVHISIVAPGGLHPRYATCTLDLIDGDDDYAASAYGDFFESLRALKEDGEIRFGRDGVLAATGKFEAYSGAYLVSPYDNETKRSETPREPSPWPILKSDGRLETSFTVDRKILLSVVKGQAPYDAENRITMEVTTGSLVIRPYGSEAEQRIPASTVGSGVRSVRADYLGGFLSTMDSKEVTVGWHARAKAIVVTGDEYQRWTLLVAPVALR